MFLENLAYFDRKQKPLSMDEILLAYQEKEFCMKTTM